MRDEDDRTVLSWAAEHGHESVVKILIEQIDANINSTDSRDKPPLSYAAENGHEAVVRLLIERDDVEVNVKDDIDFITGNFGWCHGASVARAATT